MRKKRKAAWIIVLLALGVFLAWRFLRPMNIFIVSEAFERPVDTAEVPAPLSTLRAKECAACHPEFYEEWRTTIHSQAWTEPYFQVDWLFDSAKQICKNCHIPLDRQQEHKVVGFRDGDKWDPILVDNPDFDPVLQHEGVTCTGCHLRDGAILGPFGNGDAPHPVRKLADSNQICMPCHTAEGDRWDMFYKVPPCGTVSEIRSTPGAQWVSVDGEPVARNGPADGEELLNCVVCHMPLVERPLVPGGPVRPVRRHLWRGGHDPEMVKKGLEVRLEEAPAGKPGRRAFDLTLTNVGAAHHLPTGTPDRHLTVELRVLDREGKVLKEERHTLRRTIMWRPFIVDLRDTRLPRWQPRTYRLALPSGGEAEAVEAVVRYHLLDEKRRKRIGYENREPIAYDVFRKRVALRGGQLPAAGETADRP